MGFFKIIKSLTESINSLCWMVSPLIDTTKRLKEDVVILDISICDLKNEVIRLNSSVETLIELQQRQYQQPVPEPEPVQQTNVQDIIDEAFKQKNGLYSFRKGRTQ